MIFAIMFFYAFISMTSNNLSFFSATMVFLLVSLVATTFSYDEYSKWDNYALSMPLSRKNIVRSKYILSVLLILSGCFLSVVLSLPAMILKITMDSAETLLFISIYGGLACIFIGTYMPFIYWLGVEKSRPILMLIALVPVILIFLIPKLNLSIPFSELQMETIIRKATWVVPIVGILYLLLSYQISCFIFEKKDF